MLAAVVTVWVLLLALPSSAGPQARLEGARGELRTLTEQLTDHAQARAALQDRIGRLDAEVADASSRLAELLGVRRSVRSSLERAQAGWEAARDQLGELAADAFMQTGGGSDAAWLGAVVGSTTVAELSDRLAYSEAVGATQAEAAARAELARRTLSSRAAALDAIAAERAAALDRLSAIRDEQAELLAQERAAEADVTATRDQVVALIGRLSERVRAQELGGVGRAFQGAFHVSYGEWAEALLRGLGAPDCRDNRVVLVAWQLQEFTQAAWNPLATTHRMPGSTDFNAVGVQNYRSLSQGLRATEETLRNGWDVYGYGAVVESLARCDDAMATAAAVNASRWCYGCGGGTYLIGVVPKVDADLPTYAAL